MTSHLGVVLESALKLPGGVAAVLVDSAGSVVESATWAGGDLAASSAVVSQLLRHWASVGTEFGLGTVQSMLIERPGGPAMITPMGNDIALLVVGTHSCRPGRLRLQARRARDAMVEGGRMVSEPEVRAPSQVPDHLHDLGVMIEDVTPSPPPRLASGEVVLVGAHTFRLVTKLIARLSQLKGVRSSYLRAHSPSSTIIDVVLEDGATLGTIDGTCLEEFSIERSEEGGTRLVLRAGGALAISPAPIGSPG